MGEDFQTCFDENEDKGTFEWKSWVQNQIFSKFVGTKSLFFSVVNFFHQDLLGAFQLFCFKIVDF